MEGGRDGGSVKKFFEKKKMNSFKNLKNLTLFSVL